MTCNVLFISSYPNTHPRCFQMLHTLEVFPKVWTYFTCWFCYTGGGLLGWSVWISFVHEFIFCSTLYSSSKSTCVSHQMAAVSRCQACDRLNCWPTNVACPFYNRQRLNHPDAGLGNNVPHINETQIEILRDEYPLESNFGLPQKKTWTTLDVSTVS